jgi:peptide/nickel transport system substrate-binding protein
MAPGRLTRRHLIAGMAGIAAARATRAQETQVHRGGVPLIALPRLPEHVLDSAGAGWEAAWLRSLIYDSPLRPTLNGSIIAAAGIGRGFDAEGRVLEITTRAGVLFSTGESVTAADIAASIERSRAATAAGDAWRWDHVERVEVIEGATARITLNHPDATLPATLASTLVPVTPGGAGDAATGFEDLPAGSGPFVPAQIERDLRFRANRMHWVIGQPRFDGCNVTSVGLEIERTSRLVTGLVDIVPDVPSLDVPLLENDPGIALVGGVSRRSCVLMMRVTGAPLDDVRVRQLIAAGIDREALVEGATAGTGIPTSSLFPPDHWTGSPEEDTGLRLTTREIRDRLAALGLFPGWSLRLICPEDAPTLANTAVLLQEQLAKIGIAVGVDLLTSAEMEETRASGEFDLMMALLPTWIDPHEIAHPWLHSEGARNASGFASVRMDRLLAMARATTDEMQRGLLYGDAQRIVMSQAPLVPLFAVPWLDGLRARIAGYRAYLPPSARGVASAWFTLP